MKDNKMSNFLNYLFLVLFMLYLTIYFMVDLGYYEYASYKKKVFTEDQIQKFENDLKTNKEIDITNYLTKEEDFQDKPKRIGLKISEAIEKYTKKGINILFKSLNDMANK